jgi:hypothetical protein
MPFRAWTRRERIRHRGIINAESCLTDPLGFIEPMVQEQLGPLRSILDVLYQSHSRRHIADSKRAWKSGTSLAIR